MLRLRTRRPLPRPRFDRIRRARPINLLPSVLTTFNLYWGTASILASLSGRYDAAALYVFVAIVFDGLDGAVARLTNSTSLFGKELDSLCDMVSFGVAPALMVYHAAILGVYPPGTTPYYITSMTIIGYVICSALRLARFSVFQSGSLDSFVGLPTPAAACVAASFMLFVGHLDVGVPITILVPFVAGLAVLMVSTVRYPKYNLKQLTITPNNAYRFLLICMVGVAALHYAVEHSIAMVLFPLAMLYVCGGIVETAYRRLYGTALPVSTESPEAANTTELQDSETLSDDVHTEQRDGGTDARVAWSNAASTCLEMGWECFTAVR